MRGPLAAPGDGTALFEWLDAFVVHIAEKRPLALAVTDDADHRRTRLFAEWHRSITGVAARLRSGLEP